MSGVVRVRLGYRSDKTDIKISSQSERNEQASPQAVASREGRQSHFVSESIPLLGHSLILVIQ